VGKKICKAIISNTEPEERKTPMFGNCVEIATSERLIDLFHNSYVDEFNHFQNIKDSIRFEVADTSLKISCGLQS